MSFFRKIVTRVETVLAPFPLLKRLVHGVGWTTVGTLIGSGLTFCAMIAVARLLGREDFGKLGILQSTIAMLQCFAGSSLGLTAAKHVAEYRATSPERAGHIIAVSDVTAAVIGASAAILVYFFAPWLASHALAQPSMAPLLRIATIVIALSAITAAMTGTLSGLEEFPSIALANLITGVLAFPLILAGVLWRGLNGVVIALAVQATISCVVICFIARRNASKHGIHIALRGASEWHVLWLFSLPLLLNSMIMVPVQWWCNAMLVRTCGYAEMGLYAVALQWRNLLMFLPTMLTQAALPVFSSVKGKHGEESDEFLRLVVLSQNTVVMVALPITTLCMFLSSAILFLYGRDFHGGEIVFAGVMFLIMIYITEIGLTPAIEAAGRIWVVFLLNIAWAVVYVSLVRMNVAKWRASAMGFSEAAAFILLITSYLWFFRKFIPTKLSVMVGAEMGLATTIMFVFALTPNWTHVWLALPMSCAALLLVMKYFADRQLIHSSLKSAMKAAAWQ